MGGWGSGRQGGKPLADSSRKVDFAWLIRSGQVRDGCAGSGTIQWNRNGEPYGSVSYRYDLTMPEAARLVLTFRQQRHGEDWQDREQTIRLSYTLPRLGGRRWWMHCPVRGDRVAKLYLPAGAEMFAGRKAWGLAYHSQRIGAADRPFERLFALQDKLGCERGWERPIYRPKGMWHRTFDRHLTRYGQLDDRCAVEAASMMALLRRV